MTILLVNYKIRFKEKSKPDNTYQNLIPHTDWRPLFFKKNHSRIIYSIYKRTQYVHNNKTTNIYFSNFSIGFCFNIESGETFLRHMKDKIKEENGGSSESMCTRIISKYRINNLPEVNTSNNTFSRKFSFLYMFHSMMGRSVFFFSLSGATTN